MTTSTALAYGEGMPVDSAVPIWVDGIHATFRRHAIAQVAYVPDAGLSHLIRCVHSDPSMSTVPLSTEEEGVGLLAGAWLGGQRGALLMQSSGVGNCVNLFSLWQSCRFPALVLVTMRGQFGEANPWQVPMGQITPETLRRCGLVTFEVDDASRVVETVEAAAIMAFSGPAAVAVTIGQRAIGAKAFVADEPGVVQ